MWCIKKYMIHGLLWILNQVAAQKIREKYDETIECVLTIFRHGFFQVGLLEVWLQMVWHEGSRTSYQSLQVGETFAAFGLISILECLPKMCVRLACISGSYFSIMPGIGRNLERWTCGLIFDTMFLEEILRFWGFFFVGRQLASSVPFFDGKHHEKQHNCFHFHARVLGRRTIHSSNFQLHTLP